MSAAGASAGRCLGAPDGREVGRDMPILRCKIASFLLVFGTVKGEELNEHARQLSEKSLDKEPAALERFGV